MEHSDSVIVENRLLVDLGGNGHAFNIGNLGMERKIVAGLFSGISRESGILINILQSTGNGIGPEGYTGLQFIGSLAEEICITGVCRNLKPR